MSRHLQSRLRMDTKMRLRMPREKWEAVEKARADLRRARLEVGRATERLRAAERDAATVLTVHIPSDDD